jgi:hypothetical protein
MNVKHTQGQSNCIFINLIVQNVSLYLIFRMNHTFKVSLGSSGMSWDSTGGIATGCGLDSRGVGV